jgi:hypothetical protein
VAAFLSSGASTMTASLVVMSELTLAASTRAVRTTCTCKTAVLQHLHFQ